MPGPRSSEADGFSSEAMPPFIIVILLLTTIHAALAHTLTGKTILELPVFWLAALLGVTLIHATRLSFHPILPTYGTVHIVEASLGGWLALFPTIRALARR